MNLSEPDADRALDGPEGPDLEESLWADWQEAISHGHGDAWLLEYPAVNGPQWLMQARGAARVRRQLADADLEPSAEDVFERALCAKFGSDPL